MMTSLRVSYEYRHRGYRLQAYFWFQIYDIYYLSLQFRPKRGLGLYLSYKKQLSKNSHIGLTLNTQESISLMLASVGVRSEPQQVCLAIHTLCRRSVLRVGILKQVHHGPSIVLGKIIDGRVFSFITFYYVIYEYTFIQEHDVSVHVHVLIFMMLWLISTRFIIIFLESKRFGVHRNSLPSCS